MTTLTLAALQSPDETLDYQDPASQNYRHLERCRRVRVGPSVTVVFEDMHTLSFRIQELGWVARQSSPFTVRKQLEWYNRLLPTPDRLFATICVSAPSRRLTFGADTLRQSLTSGRLVLRSDAGHEIVSNFMNERVSDRVIGLFCWAEFQFNEDCREAFIHDGTLSWRLEIEAEGYNQVSDDPSATVLDSLTADMRC